ncbi:MAG TPA: hypothetical protein VL197_12695 [Nitrospirota bacterium]|nr:hypothetical protein [Nitrospirota bacterium]
MSIGAVLGATRDRATACRLSVSRMVRQEELRLQGSRYLQA